MFVFTRTFMFNKGGLSFLFCSVPFVTAETAPMVLNDDLAAYLFCANCMHA